MSVTNEAQNSATTQHHVGSNRILSVDSMRGLAMVLVILQHCYQVVDPHRITAISDMIIYLPTRMASVAFMAVSGMMISFFLYSTVDWKRVYRRFARRAIMLLLVAHVAIHVARYFYYDPVGLRTLIDHILYDYPITDTIALALLIAPFAIRFVGTGARAMIAIALLVVTPIVLILFQPTNEAALIVRGLVFGGIPGSHWAVVGWPLVPWVGIFLCGSLLGQALAEVRTGTMSLADLVRKMRRAGTVLMAAGIVLTGAYKVAAYLFGPFDPVVFNALYPSRTTALLPIYLAVLLWTFAYLMAAIDGRGQTGRPAWALSVFGRTSLFTYVNQFIFVHSLPALLGLKWQMGIGGFVALFLCALPASWLVSFAYGRIRGWIVAGDFAHWQGRMLLRR